MVQITLGDKSNSCVVDPLHFDADPDADPGYQNDADPDPQHCLTVVHFLPMLL
jgi:hypothetical protein